MTTLIYALAVLLAGPPVLAAQTGEAQAGRLVATGHDDVLMRNVPVKEVALADDPGIASVAFSREVVHRDDLGRLLGVRLLDLRGDLAGDGEGSGDAGERRRRAVR